MRIETRRLVLRPWREADAPALFKYASDPAVGPAAGWKAHESEAESLDVLRTILINDRTWALTITPSDEPVGSIGVFPGRDEGQNGEWEIGYILSLYFAFGAERIWCAHADFNDKSRRVIEKCGFHYRFSAPWTSALGDVRNSLYYAIEAEEFDDD